MGRRLPPAIGLRCRIPPTRLAPLLGSMEADVRPQRPTWRDSTVPMDGAKRGKVKLMLLSALTALTAAITFSTEQQDSPLFVLPLLAADCGKRLSMRQRGIQHLANLLCQCPGGEGFAEEVDFCLQNTMANNGFAGVARQVEDAQVGP